MAHGWQYRAAPFNNLAWKTDQRLVEFIRLVAPRSLFAFGHDVETGTLDQGMGCLGVLERNGVDLPAVSEQGRRVYFLEAADVVRPETRKASDVPVEKGRAFHLAYRKGGKRTHVHLPSQVMS